jgi:hypothetical protein
MNTTKKQRGRPKGEPTVTRSIAFKEPINEYLKQKHAETMLSYNTLVNMAVEEMMKKDNNKER